MKTMVNISHATIKYKEINIYIRKSHKYWRMWGEITKDVLILPEEIKKSWL